MRRPVVPRSRVSLCITLPAVWQIALAALVGACAAGGTTTEQPGAGSRPDAGANLPSGGSDASGPAKKDAAGNRPEASAPGGYRVQGPTVLDASGKPHLFRGLDRPSLEWSSMGDQLTEGDYQVIAAWGANVVRLSLNQDFWLKTDAGGTANPNYDASYETTVDQQVRWAEMHGLDVILDLHWSDKGDFNVFAQCKGASSGCQQVMPDQHSLLFWQEVANKYKGDPRVLFELYNEPFVGGYAPSGSDWTIWLDGGPTNGFQAVGMQQLYDTIRKTAGAPNLVIVGGLSWAFDLSGVAANPVNGTNILYATHPYQTDAQAQWDSAFGALSATYPIIATEFGDRSGSCSTSYARNFVAYANKKAAGSNPANEISWTGWAFIVANNVCTFPTLLQSYYTPNAFGTLVQNALMAGP